MSKLSSNKVSRFVTNIAANASWNVPGSFGFARMLGPSYSLRCVVFHNISAKRSPFTKGIGVTVTPESFERTLRFLTANYSPVTLEDVLTDCGGRGLPSRALLVTFDDAYASVADCAAPLCKQFGVPAVFFVNAAFLDNERLEPDNLICYVADALGIQAINRAVHSVRGNEAAAVGSLTELFDAFLPALSLAEREHFLQTLRQLAGVDEKRLAKQASLYVTREQLRDLASFGFEIGNHTYTHTHCRSLSARDLEVEIDKNKQELEAVTGRKVSSFSQPYGSSRDLTPELTAHLKRSGHRAVFLSESVANPLRPHAFRIDRISTCAESDDRLFFEIEVLPRFRAIRNRLFRHSRLT